MGDVLDWFEDVFSTVIDVFVEIGEFIVDVVEEIIDGLSYVWGKITDFIGEYWYIILPLVVVAAYAYWPLIAPVIQSVLADIALVMINIYQYAEIAFAAIGAFLEFIHFKTILLINQVAFLVSEDYRNMMNDFYGKLSYLSAAIGFVPQFMSLALRNARAIVLDVSTSLGRSYDLSEIIWLQNVADFSKVISDQAKVYQENPWQIFYDIDEYLIKPSCDVKAGSQQVVLTSIEGALSGIKDIVEDVVVVRNDLDQFVNDLPTDLREWVDDKVGPILADFDDFIAKDYTPAIQAIDNIIAVVEGRQEDLSTNIKILIDRLKRPGKFLQEINDLPLSERLMEEDRIGEIASRKFVREARELQPEIAAGEARLAKILEALEEERPPVAWSVNESARPQRPAFQSARPRETWFVGDY